MPASLPQAQSRGHRPADRATRAPQTNSSRQPGGQAERRPSNWRALSPGLGAPAPPPRSRCPGPPARGCPPRAPTRSRRTKGAARRAAASARRPQLASAPAGTHPASCRAAAADHRAPSSAQGAPRPPPSYSARSSGRAPTSWAGPAPRPGGGVTPAPGAGRNPSCAPRPPQLQARSSRGGSGAPAGERGVGAQELWDWRRGQPEWEDVEEPESGRPKGPAGSWGLSACVE